MLLRNFDVLCQYVYEYLEFTIISAAGQPVGAANTGKVLTGDLDSSLASLAQNLTINKSAQQQVK